MIKLSIKINNKGLTLVELLVVIVITCILLVIAVPSINGIIEATEKKACEESRLQLERIYETHLVTEDIDHSETFFQDFKSNRIDGEICPEKGEIRYIENEVVCSVHHDHDGPEENDNGEVPYL